MACNGSACNCAMSVQGQSSGTANGPRPNRLGLEFSIYPLCWPITCCWRGVPSRDRVSICGSMWAKVEIDDIGCVPKNTARNMPERPPFQNKHLCQEAIEIAKLIPVKSTSNPFDPNPTEEIVNVSSTIYKSKLRSISTSIIGSSELMT